MYGFVPDGREALVKSPNLPKIAFVARPKNYVATNGREITASAGTLLRGT
jgi:2-methylaconitate cis-trans-isomerase PrpF